jgi:lanosterol synthase
MNEIGSYDVAVVGGGPVGCVVALSCAGRGARTLVLEANERAAIRLAGEWLHPPAVEILERLGIDLASCTECVPGRGFVVFPEDGSTPIVLPYPGAGRGLGVKHESLVAALRAALSRRDVAYLDARATGIDGQRLEYRGRDGAVRRVTAGSIVGASGRSGFARRAVEVQGASLTCSRMAGVLLQGAALPFEGYGHVFLGGPGPILVYRVSPSEVRVCFDVPLSLSTRDGARAALWEAYGPVLPRALRDPLRRSLSERDIEWATNQVQPRVSFGRPGFALVGDAAGHHHPLTAAGLTLGFQDAVAFAGAARFETYARRRRRESRVPEVLAGALYDVFSGASEDRLEVRQAMYALWRRSDAERRRTMRLLSCDVVAPAEFGTALFKVLSIAAHRSMMDGIRAGDPARAFFVAKDLGSRIRSWLVPGTQGRAEAPDAGGRPDHAPDRSRRGRAEVERALELGARALVAEQDQDGSWEGECIWCALLAAEYVLAFHFMGREIPESRRARILLHFERTRLSGGLWGLAEVGEPSLFVTTLVYVAARTLGLSADHPLLAPARAFFAREGGVTAIPTWGKFWLALLSLYRWEGVNPVAPELWAMPSALPIHPSRYYCHTRLIYMAMATLYAERAAAPVTPLTQALRDELFPGGFDRVDFRVARNLLREEDLFAPPGAILKRGYDVLSIVDRLRSRTARKEVLAELRNHIRWELRSTEHTAISPVSGLLDMIALWLDDPNDVDLLCSLDRFECWIWEDDQNGLRVAGARTAIWDTSFAIQALGAAAPHTSIGAARRRGAEFLASQQIRSPLPGFAENHRTDACGGYPLSFGWHGWAVGDCTAEAILARLETAPETTPDEDVALAARFILRTQGPDGGFGSYEEKRVRSSIEWLNPAEMFGDSMAEGEYVECTASCIAALAKIASERPHLLERPELAGVPSAIRRAARAIRRQQLPSGAWAGAWGVRFIYGTWFGVRGLLAAGAPPTDPAIRKACEWLKSRQRPDGGWGERLVAHATDYVPHDEAQAVQTAWALLALIEAREPDFVPLERAARALARLQLGNGQWPRQDPPGLFFRTALLEYVLYRSYFPVWALGAFETRRAERDRFTDDRSAVRARLPEARVFVSEGSHGS